MRRSVGSVLMVIFATAMPVFADGLRDVKPPLAYPEHWMGIVSALVAAVLVVMAVRYLRSRMKETRGRNAPVRLPWDEAYARLSELEARGLPLANRLKEYFSELSDIVRRYIEARFAIHAPEMTTEEFLQQARISNHLSDLQKETLKEFLSTCDMVKFARHAPAGEEIRKSFQSARRFVDETKNVPQDNSSPVPR